MAVTAAPVESTSSDDALGSDEMSTTEGEDEREVKKKKPLLDGVIMGVDLLKETVDEFAICLECK